MYIFLDTNVFYNDWFLNNANFRYLFHYLSNEDGTLLISRLVCQEAENIREREFNSAKIEIERQFGQVRKLTNIDPVFSIPNCSDYNLLEVLRNRCENSVLVDYVDVPHDLLVTKALKILKPFSDGEKGYRDSLIWLSLVKFLKDSSIDEEVVFITNNKSDFFLTGKDGFQLHPHLIADLRLFGVSADIRPYDSLFKFIQDSVDTKDHAIDRQRTRYEAEEFLEEGGVHYIQNSPPSQYRDALILAGLPTAIANEILSVGVDIMEGVEDCDLLDYEDLSKDEIFVTFAFDLRIAILKFKFPTSAYHANSQVFDRNLMNFEEGDDFTYAEMCVRAYFHISCIYNPRSVAYKDFTVVGLRFRI